MRKKYSRYLDPITLPNGVTLSFGRIQHEGKWVPVLHRTDRPWGIVLHEAYDKPHQAAKAAMKLGKEIAKIYENGGVCG